MSCVTTKPGYTGYKPNFIREYPINLNPLGNKYLNVASHDQPLPTFNPYLTTNKANQDPSCREFYQGTESTIVDHHKKRQIQIDERLASREKFDTQKSSASHWGTMYRRQHDGWKEHNQAKELAKDIPLSKIGGNWMFERRRADAPGWRPPIVAGEDPMTSYKRDYGRDPLLRVAAEDGRATFVKNASTNEFFSGTTKCTLTHTPGYAGFVPATAANFDTFSRLARRPRTEPEHVRVMKTSLHRTMIHQVPGYTGFHPDAATNNVFNPANKAHRRSL